MAKNFDLSQVQEGYYLSRHGFVCHVRVTIENGCRVIQYSEKGGAFAPDYVNLTPEQFQTDFLPGRIRSPEQARRILELRLEDHAQTQPSYTTRPKGYNRPSSGWTRDLCPQGIFPS